MRWGKINIPVKSRTAGTAFSYPQFYLYEKQMSTYRERSRRRNSDVWMFPGMQDAGGRYYENTGWSPERIYRGDNERYYRRDPRSRDYDTDIYEQEIGRREDRRFADTYNDGNRGHEGRFEERGRYDHDDRHDGFFRRAGERLREFWDELRTEPHESYAPQDRSWNREDQSREYRGDRRRFFDEPFREDVGERRYGADNWAPNHNRGYDPRWNKRNQYNRFENEDHGYFR